MYYCCESYDLFGVFIKTGNLSKCFCSDCLVDIFRYLTIRSFVKDISSYTVDDLRVKYISSHTISDKSFDIYLITTDRCGKEYYLTKYKCPQALCFLIYKKNP